MHKIKNLIDRFHRIPSKVKYLLFVLLFFTLQIIFVYDIAQNILRNSANDPQIQIAQNASFLLQKNAPMGPIVPEISVDIAQNLESFIQIYDEKGSFLDGNALLNGKSPIISKTAFVSAKKYRESRLTWQPEKGVRIATVISHYNGQNPGYVLSGRSLSETENRITDIGKLCFFAWLATMFFVINFYYFLFKK